MTAGLLRSIYQDLPSHTHSLHSVTFVPTARSDVKTLNGRLLQVARSSMLTTSSNV